LYAPGFPTELRGPNESNYSYWLYYLIESLEINEKELNIKKNNFDGEIIERFSDERIRIYYKLSDYDDSNHDNNNDDHKKKKLLERYIKFYGVRDDNNENRKIIINYIRADNNENNYDNYKELFNEIIRIVSRINEKKENENNKVRLFIDRSAIKNYTEDKKKWKHLNTLGQFKPTFFTKLGFNDQLEWIPDKNTNISIYNAEKIGNAIGQKLVDDGTPTNTKKIIDTAAVNEIMGYIGDPKSYSIFLKDLKDQKEESSKPIKGGKTKNQKKSKKSRKSRKINRRNKKSLI
jgi:hypothetical protein